MQARVNGTKKTIGNNTHAYSFRLFLNNIIGRSNKLLIQTSPINAILYFLSSIKNIKSEPIINMIMKRK